MSNITLKDGRLVPRQSVVERNNIQNNGVSMPATGYYVVSGSSSTIQGSTTGSVTIQLDTFRI